jgi:hypothetical protein
LYLNQLEVFTIRIEPIHFIEVPYVTDLTQINRGKAARSGRFYSYPLHGTQRTVPGTIAFNTAGANIIDFIGAFAYPVWIIEQRQVFIDGDRVVVQMDDGRIFAGKSRILTAHTLILRDTQDINREVVDFSKIRFLGRLVRGMASI